MQKLTSEISKISKIKASIKGFFSNKKNQPFTLAYKSPEQARYSNISSEPTSRRSSLAPSIAPSPLVPRKNFSQGNIESARSSIKSPLISPVCSPLNTPNLSRKFVQEVSSSRSMNSRKSPSIVRKNDNSIEKHIINVKKTSRLTKAQERASEIANEIEDMNIDGVKSKAFKLRFLKGDRDTNVTNTVCRF
ncbi:MAG: hypothetical protein ACK4OM_02455 [Alphaproteobacteria bacterium]